MFKVGDHIKVTKMAAVKDAEFPTPDPKDYTPGVINEGVSLPIEYEMEGVLSEEIETMQSLKMARSKRNGVQAVGFLITSPITSVLHAEVYLQLTTLNSVYRVERIGDGVYVFDDDMRYDV